MNHPAQSDTGNAELLRQRHGHEIRFVPEWGKWLSWDGRRWKIELSIQERCKDTIRAAAQDARADLIERRRQLQEAAQRSMASGGTDDADREKESKLSKVAEERVRWLFKSESAARRHSMEVLARTEDGIPISHERLNADPWLFNVQNGTLDLRTGEITPHDPIQHITQLAACAFDPDADCPLWRQTLNTSLPDPEIQGFLQRYLGSCLAGTVKQHGFAFLHGRGQNGKSTILQTILSVVGDYGCTLPVEALLINVNRGHPTELADLLGRRFVVSNEAPAGRRFDESRLKELTDGTVLKVRRMREDPWELRPTHKLTLSGNHLPRISGQDEGIWRRVFLVPFEIEITKPNPELPVLLQAEAPGILNWLLAGCLAWQSVGLMPPEAVRRATTEYRESQDIIGDFFTEQCRVTAGARCDWKNFQKAYQKFAEDCGDEPLKKHQLIATCKERGWKRVRANGKVWLMGVGLVSEPEYVDGRTRAAREEQGTF